MLQLRALDTLGGGNRDWLKARHHFAVEAQGNPAHARLGNLVADARVLGATLEAGQRIAYPRPSTRYGYLVPARGRVMVNDQQVGERDGIAIAGERGIAITAIEPAEIILVDTA